MRHQTGPSSGFEMEAWLPQNWTGRFLTVGNGGLGGCIAASDMTYGAARGFAVVATDNGHAGNTGVPFLNNPGVVEDFAYRAIHNATQLGKQAVNAFYGNIHTKAYYLGCSTGGRQGFKEAQSFPGDFDGIVAGAPAFAFQSLIAWGGYLYTITGRPGSPTFLSRNQWNLVLRDILDQCDGLDGHIDNVIEDPDLCQYNPERLIAGDRQNSTYLTGQQAETVRKVLSPVYNNRGELVYPRLQPGADASAFYMSGRMNPYSLDWMHYVVYQDPSWDGTMGVSEIEALHDVDAFGIDTFNGDLSGARGRGVKILHYHGLQDGIISSDNSARYYNLVSRTLGLPPSELDEFYRYFRISGMGHCQGGSGAYNIGNSAGGLAGEEPDRNVLSAIVRWVEGGEAPEYILGTAFVDAGKTQVRLQRRHCKYPLRNEYSGIGDPDDAESWSCV